MEKNYMEKTNMEEPNIIDEDTYNLNLDVIIELRDNINKQIYFFTDLQNSESKINNDMCIIEQQNTNKSLSIIDSTLSDDYHELCKINNNQLKNLRKYLNIVNNIIYNRCNHIWIEDYIDVDLDTSYKLIYCNNCKLQDKSI